MQRNSRFLLASLDTNDNVLRHFLTSTESDYLEIVSKATNMSTSINYDAFQQPGTFIVLLSVTIPSLICSSTILIYFLRHRRTMIVQSPHHHPILILTAVSFLYTSFDLPFSLNYFRTDQHYYRSIRFCIWWYWFDYSLLGISFFVAMIASLQRHILIFHSNWLRKVEVRLVLHYLPLLIAVLYTPLLYIILMYLYRCDVYFNPEDGWCAYPC
jgi:hypothetical protein